MEAPVLDMHKAKDNPILVHPEEDWKLKIPLGGDHKRNLCATALEEHGDVDKVLSECKYTVEHTYHTRANQQTMMETFRTACYMDHFGRLNRTFFYADSFPRKTNCWKSTGYSGLQSACYQTTNWWRIWSKTDFRQ